MKVAVIGGNGFIGKNVVKQLDDVLVVRRDNLHEIAAYAPDVVINLAWEGVSGLAARTDEELQRKNVDFNERLFELCKPSCKRWIGAGSQAEVNSPDVAYARYKLIVLNRIQELCLQNKISFAWVRIYSTYGPGDNKNNFLPYLINELLCGKDVPLTDQNIPWDYLYVEDAGRAIAHLAHGGDGIFDLGSGTTHMTQDVAKLIRDKINPNLKLLFGARPSRSVELKELVADISLLREVGWEPRVLLNEGIDNTINYFRR